MFGLEKLVYVVSPKNFQNMQNTDVSYKLDRQRLKKKLTAAVSRSMQEVRENKMKPKQQATALGPHLWQGTFTYCQNKD